MASLLILVPVLILALFGVVLYRRLIRAPRYRSWWVRLGAVALLVTLGGSVFVGFAYQSGFLDHPLSRVIGAIGMTWLATAFYLLLGTLVGALVALGLRIARRADLVRTWHRVSVPGIVAASLLVTGYGVIESRQVRVTEETVGVAGLPAEFEGYRVAVVGDLHVGPIRGAGLVADVVRLTNGSAPDAVLLVGDLTDGTTMQFGHVLTPLGDLTAPDGAFAVTGNHEYYAGDSAGWVALWRDLGIVPLLNESALVERGNAVLRIAGVNDEAGSTGGFGDPGDVPVELQPDLAAALSEVSPEQATLLLAHQPGVGTDPLVATAGVDLMLFGHTHGGQIWPFTLFVALANPTVAGLDEVAGTTAYTTRGAGTWGPPLRVLVPPEISVLTLTARP